MRTCGRLSRSDLGQGNLQIVRVPCAHASRYAKTSGRCVSFYTRPEVSTILEMSKGLLTDRWSLDRSMLISHPIPEAELKRSVPPDNHFVDQRHKSVRLRGFTQLLLFHEMKKDFQLPFCSFPVPVLVLHCLNLRVDPVILNDQPVVFPLVFRLIPSHSGILHNQLAQARRYTACIRRTSPYSAHRPLSRIYSGRFPQIIQSGCISAAPSPIP